MKILITRSVVCIIVAIVCLHAPAMAADQCNTTSQCRTIFGPVATDCSNSKAQNSICMCGIEACAKANFTSPSTVEAGKSPLVEVEPVSAQGVESILLYVNNQAVRTERVAPYVWGGGRQDDSPLLNMVAGNYSLRSEVSYTNGITASATQNLTVNALASANFTSPSTIDEGGSAEVQIETTPAQGVESVTLYIDDQVIRTERHAPYTWGEPAQADALLTNMVAGSYALRTEVAYTNGTIATATQTLTVNAVSDAVFTSASTFTSGTEYQVEVEPTPRNGVQKVELFVDGQSVRTETLFPYQWGGTNANDSLLRSMGAGQYQLTAEVTYNNGQTVTANQELTLTGPPDNPSTENAWSDPATWGGSVPTSGDVTIAAGQQVTLDMDVTLDELTINGDLTCADKDLRVSARIIMVHGRMDCGSLNNPYTKELTITLTGSKPNNIVNDGLGMGTKVIGVMGGGILNLHGEDRKSWLMLDETAQAGSRELVLEEATNWRVGDRLVVTSTSQDMKEAEEVTVSQVNGRIVTLESPLLYRHFGEIQTFSNATRTWNVDTRAEVGLLSRNIKIVGDGSSQAQKFGGHMMVMAGSEAYISGVQMDRLGQQGLLGRYPFHWHLAGDVSGQYIRNSSIYNSFNRCVTVHGSHNALIDDTVCFKHVGHGYFLEDGVETGNVFNRNLGAWTIKPSAADALIPSDRQTGLASRGPATFWISNGDNTFTNNAAAGSEGLGYWYDTEDNVTGPSRNLPGGDINPRRSRFGGFTDNRVHSSSMALAICSKGAGVPGYLPPNGSMFKNTTVFYGGNGAVWPCDGAHKFDNLMVLDTGTNDSHRASFVAARPSEVSNSLFVANSKLAGNSPQARAAFGIYDFGVETIDSHVENYTESSNSPVFTEVGGALTFMHQSIERVTNKNTNYWLKLKSDDNSTSASVIRDLDNSIGFGSGMSLTPDLPLMVDNSCQNMPGIDQAKMCPGRFVQVRLNMGGQDLPNIELGRSDISTKKTLATGVSQRSFYKVHMAVNRSYRYEVDFKTQLSSGSLNDRNSMSVQTDSGNDGDVATISLKNLKSNARVTGNGWTEVSSLSALNQSDGNAWFKSANTIHLRMICRGNNRLLKARSVANIAF